MTRDQTKAANYIRQLDDARCAGSWDQVPELVRKVRKHAPERACLTITAEAEHAVRQASPARPSSARPSSDRSPAQSSSNTSLVAQYISALIDAIEKENQYAEDEFQARVCLGWIHWYLEEPSLAIARLPQNIGAEYGELCGANRESTGWTRVCAVKALYLRGSAQSTSGPTLQALETFKSGLPVLASISKTNTAASELGFWSELYLTTFCMTSSHLIKLGKTSAHEIEVLSVFRAWDKFWEGSSPASQGGRAPEANVLRRQVWKEYYFALSDHLQQERPLSMTSLSTISATKSTRLLQLTELKRVEARYETMLLNEVQFPDAESSSEEVETFIEVVMQTWRVLCRGGWQQDELGGGGFEAVSREVLDILYRAATKTFHSTAILRHLFTVHLVVAEFELAFSAFDTYLEVVKKGRARVEKTGEHVLGLDNDETVLETASECIKAYCRYGARRGAEKGRELGQYLEGWLANHHRAENGERSENGNSASTKIESPWIFAKAWRCIGIAYAQWARMTYDAASRDDIQLRAVKCFQKALLPEYRDTSNVETLFALGLLLAERRELGAAIEVVKGGLLSKSATQKPDSRKDTHAGNFYRERLLIPLWHLLAVLLSAREEFLTAARSCEGAFEQFEDPRTLFGDIDITLPYRSEHLNEKATSRKLGVVDQMDDSEKQNVLEVKMTQLSLIEIMEGPEVAVNASDELLSLYRRLFGDPEKDVAAATPAKLDVMRTSKSSAGTIKSMKGSLFGHRSRSIRKSNPASSIMETGSVSARPYTLQTVPSMKAPMIQVTSANGNTDRQQFQPSSNDLGNHHHEKLQKRSSSLSRPRSVGSRARSSSRPRSRSAGPVSPFQPPTEIDGELYFTPPVDSQHRDRWLYDSRPDQVGLAVSPHPESTSSWSELQQPDDPKPSRPNLQQLPQNETLLKSRYLDDRLPQGLSYSSRTTPATRFPDDQRRRRKLSILVKLWLLIAGFYRRASLCDDAKGAIDEAQRLVQAVETSVTRESNGKASMSDIGFGGGRSVAQLRGDLLSERGYLAAAESSPHVALSHFEAALMYSPEHPSAIIGLSNILLDIYTEELSSPPLMPLLIIPGQANRTAGSSVNSSTSSTLRTQVNGSQSLMPTSSVSSTLHGPLGLSHTRGPSSTFPNLINQAVSLTPSTATGGLMTEAGLPLLDRIAARDRAYGLLSELTKLGTGWNNSEAWFALARAYEEGGQPQKAREVLWWCVELEEGRGVREWGVVGSGGYVL